MNIKLLLSGMVLGCTSMTFAAERPNILLFIGDDCSYSDLSIYGNTNAITPNLQKLVKQGMTFSNCFQATAMSSPTRHCLYTGLYPVKSGAYPNHTFVKKGVESFVQYFRAIGYKTALYGKEHVAPREVFNYDYLGEYRGGKMNFDVIEKYIKDNTDQPFFMVVASHESHGPYTCGNPKHWKTNDIKLPPHFVDTEEIRKEYIKYLAEVEVMDSQVGQVMDILQKTGKVENTILVFTSEQGNGFPFAKWTCYNQGLHSGLVVRYPGKIEAGSHSDALVEYVDVIPTLLEACGENTRKYKNLDGSSFYKILLGKKKEHKKYSYGIQTTRGIIQGSPYYGVRSVTTKKYNYILNLTPEAEFQCLANVPTFSMWGWVEKSKTDSFARSQIERYRKRPSEELYDIEKDPFTMHNLANDPKYATIKKDLRKHLEKWMKEQGDKGQQTELEALEHLTKDGKDHLKKAAEGRSKFKHS